MEAVSRQITKVGVEFDATLFPTLLLFGLLDCQWRIFEFSNLQNRRLTGSPDKGPMIRSPELFGFSSAGPVFRRAQELLCLNRVGSMLNITCQCQDPEIMIFCYMSILRKIRSHAEAPCVQFSFWLYIRLRDIVEKQVPANLKPIVGYVQCQTYHIFAFFAQSWAIITKNQHMTWKERR